MNVISWIKQHTVQDAHTLAHISLTPPPKKQKTNTKELMPHESSTHGACSQYYFVSPVSFYFLSSKDEFDK